MNVVLTTSYVGCDAECGDSGLLLATELTDIQRAACTPAPDVTCSPRIPARTVGFLFADDSHARDALKYAWLAPDPPRIPRREATSTYVKFWLILIGFLAMGTLEVWGVVAFGKWAAGLFV